jgi:glycosyltransferase involved in cell wall biosynthesis
MVKKRILFIADSIKRKTGYATVARNIITRLVKSGKYEIAQLGLADIPTAVDLPIHYYSMVKSHEKCCQKGKVIEYVGPNDPKINMLKLEPNVPVIEAGPCIRGEPEGNDNYGYISTYFVIQHFKPDFVIPINDVWGLYNINHLRNRRCFKFVPYMAIDSECMFPAIEIPNPAVPLPAVDPMLTVEKSDKCVVFTDWAQSVLNKTASMLGKPNFTNMATIPHGVDNSLWKPLPDKYEIRKKYFNLDHKVILVGCVARNQPRKRLDATLQTLRYFIDNYEKDKKIMVYFHCSMDDRMGWPLPWLAKYYGLEDRCIFDPRLKPGVGPTEEQLNEIVNAFDVHLSLTNSEGWHLPALETLAAGIPTILTKYSAHADWGKEALILSKVAAYEHEPRTGFIKAIADVGDAAKHIKLLSESKLYYKEWQEKGLKLAKKLDWDNVCVKWEELLDSIDVSDLSPTRYSDPFVSDPSVPDFTLTTFPKEEDKFDRGKVEQVI